MTGMFNVQPMTVSPKTDWKVQQMTKKLMSLSMSNPWDQYIHVLHIVIKLLNSGNYVHVLHNH